MFLVGILGYFYHNQRPSILGGFVIIYLFTQSIGGYSAARAYKKMEGENHTKHFIFSSFLLPIIFIIIIFITNTILTNHGSSAAVPIIYIIILFIGWLLMAGICSYIGYFIGKRQIYDVPYKSNSSTPLVQINVSDKWKKQRIIYFFLFGLIEFLSICSVMYYVFNSFWLYQYYLLFGFIFFGYLLFSYMNACFTVLYITLLLKQGDYRWHWFSFLIGSSPVFYLQIFIIWFFFTSFNSGDSVTSFFYFLYTSLFSLLMIVAHGSLGVRSCYAFIPYVFDFKKDD